jgi:ligand-binding sensor domain-containing protein/signal transduction histidine kinase
LKLSLFVLFLIFPFTFGFAQPYYFKHYQVENGLSNNTVYCCLQDKQGFLWFGTKDGLNRFDGSAFKTFTHNTNDKRSIGNNFIHTLYTDDKGILWVGTDAGVYKYNAHNESFSYIKTTNTAAISCIVKCKNDDYWFVEGGALYIYHDKTGKLVDMQPFQHFDATSVTVDSVGAVWVSTTVGTIEKFDPANNSFKSYNLFTHSKPVSSTNLEKIAYIDNNTIFVGTSSQGLKVFNCNTGIYKDVLTYNQNKTEIYVRDFLKYADNEYWIATESGVFIYNTKKNTFTNLKKQYNDPYSISDNAIYSLHKDSEGGIWAGTYFGGVNYYPKQYATFNKFYPGIDRNSLKGNVVREICKDQYGNLWMGTEDNGLNKLSSDKRTWTNYNPGGKNSIANTNIHGLVADGRNLFVGTFNRGLDILDIPTGKVVRHFLAGPKPNELKSSFVVCFCKTTAGTILVGTTTGLYRYNKASHDFTLIKHVPPRDFIYAMIEDHNGTVWVGTLRDGIYYFNPKTDLGGKLDYKYPVKEALNSSTVNGIFEDSDHQIWFATEGLGIWRYNPAKNQYKIYDSNNGLPSNYVFRMQEDASKNLWISTSRGLVSLNLLNQSLKVYTKANGLLSDQFNYNSSFKDADGTMYFGCVKGMISFNPLSFRNNNFIAPVYITGFQVYNKEIAVNHSSLLNTSIIYTRKINLNYNQSSFSIDFAALSYPSPEMTQYKYKMEGLDNRWNYLKTNRKVYFTQLLPGHYTFIVMAANNSGNWNATGTRLEINILPPFWKSIWAYIAYLILAAIAVYYLLRRYHFKIGEKNDRIINDLEHNKERQIYNAKIEFFTNVAHEIRTPLTLIKGPMEKVIKKAESVPEIYSNLKIMEKNTNRLLDLTNQLLDFRKTEMNGFSLNFVKLDITDLLTDIFLQFKLQADQKNLSYALKHREKHRFAYIDAETFTKILNNLLSNAIKYGTAKVEMELLETEQDNTSITIEIRNDGYLIPEEMKEKIFEPFFRMKEAEKQVGTGIGLSLSRSLVELQKGTLVLSRSTNNLNTFTLTLPCKPG